MLTDMNAAPALVQILHSCGHGNGHAVYPYLLSVLQWSLIKTQLLLKKKKRSVFFAIMDDDDKQLYANEGTGNIKEVYTQFAVECSMKSTLKNALCAAQ